MKNREILFRGKRVDNGDWVEGYYYKFNDKPYISGQYDTFGGSYCHEIIPETVGQFTGLTDKNGTKIFEGDLLHRHMNIHWVVTFKQSTWIADSPTGAFGLYLSASQFKETTITGNIHDNPTT